MIEVITPPQLKEMVRWLYRGTEQEPRIECVDTKEVFHRAGSHIVLTIRFKDGDFDKLDLSTFVDLIELKLYEQSRLNSILCTFREEGKKSIYVGYTIDSRCYLGAYKYNFANAKLQALYLYIKEKLQK